MSEPPNPGLPITCDDGPSKGRYVVLLDGAEAEMTYSRAGDSIVIIDHTSVPEALRGRHIGEALVRSGVEDARAEVAGSFRFALSPRP